MIDPIGTIRDLVEDLSYAHARWSEREDNKPAPAARKAANEAVAAIDGLLRELHKLRTDLGNQMRASDDATAARVDALLKRGTP